MHDDTGATRAHRRPRPLAGRTKQKGDRMIQLRRHPSAWRCWRCCCSRRPPAAAPAARSRGERRPTAANAGQGEHARDDGRHGHPRRARRHLLGHRPQGRRGRRGQGQRQAPVLGRPGLRQAGHPDPERDRQQGRRHRGHPAGPAGARAGGQEGHRRRHPGGRASTPASASTQSPGALSYFGQDESRRRRDRRQAGLRGRLQAPALRHPGAGAGAAGGPLRRGEEDLHRQVREALRQRHRHAVGEVDDRRQAQAGHEHRLRRHARRPVRAERRSTPIKDAGSKAKVGTFDLNPQIPPKIKSGDLAVRRSTSSPTCRATRRSTRCGSTRTTATSSAAASRR